MSDTFIPGFYHPIGLDFHPVYMTHCPCLLVLCPPNTASLVFYPGCLHQHPPGGDQASEKQACCCACLAVSHLQLEMLVCITLTRTAVRELLGHGKTLMVPEKNTIWIHNFPQLIKIKHLFFTTTGGRGQFGRWRTKDGINQNWFRKRQGSKPCLCFV